MSLINEALKKAQRQRGGEPSLPLSEETVQGGRVLRREKPIGFNSFILRVGLGGVILVFLAVGGYYVSQILLAPEAPPPIAPKAVVAKKAPEPNAATATQPNHPKAAATETNAPTTKQPAETVSAEKKAEITKPAEQPVVPTPPSEIKVPVGPPKMDAKAIAYLEGLRIAGIRASATDAKVLMNDRVYRAGDTIEHELGIKLVSITSNSLTFENEAGVRYTRSF